MGSYSRAVCVRAVEVSDADRLQPLDHLELSAEGQVGKLRAARSVGGEVVTAGNGLDALERLRRSRADAVLLDVKMPVLDGFGFLNASAADPSNARAPVVVMSADDQLQRRAMQLGAHGFLRKPFAVAELLASVQQVL